MDTLLAKITAKAIIVFAPPGARKDFVAGWLGYCDSFVSTHWKVDPLVGHSELNSYGWSIVNIIDAAERGDITLDPTADRTVALTCHITEDMYSGEYHDKLKDLISTGAVRLVFVDLNGADLLQVYWDRVIKAELYLGMPEYDFMRDHLSHVLKIKFHTNDIVTDDHAKTVVENIINVSRRHLKMRIGNPDVDWVNNKQLQELSPTLICYRYLFKPGGSRYLCETLGITAADRLHNYWDMLLPFIIAPDKCRAFGQDWDRSMLQQ